jgi:sugar phosphate isomerase/epimerase
MRMDNLSLIRQVSFCRNAKEIEMLYGAMNFPVRPLLEEVESVGKLGFDYLEVAMDPPHGHHSAIRGIESELMKALEQRKLSLVCHLPTFISSADLTEGLRWASLNEIYASLEVAARLQTLKVVLHPGYISGLGRFVMDKVKENTLKSLEAIVAKAHELGVCLCLENMFPKGHWLVRPGDFPELLDRFPSLFLTLDTGHAHMADSTDRMALEFIERFSDRIGHVHVSDNFGVEDNHLPVGAGTVEFQALVRSLKAKGYNDTITLEVFSKDRDYVKISRQKIEEMFLKE